MKVTHCLEVGVRFKEPSFPMVAITLGNGPTSSQYLRIENDGVTLSIKFCDKDDDVRREINYNFAHIVEYNCDGWVGRKS